MRAEADAVYALEAVETGKRAVTGKADGKSPAEAAGEAATARAAGKNPAAEKVREAATARVAGKNPAARKAREAVTVRAAGKRLTAEKARKAATAQRKAGGRMISGAEKAIKSGMCAVTEVCVYGRATARDRK